MLINLDAIECSELTKVLGLKIVSVQPLLGRSKRPTGFELNLRLKTPTT